MNERLQVFRRQNFMTGMTDNYSYDALYQLTQVTRGASVTENYGYDAVGNRLSALGVSPWTYDFSNRLTGTPATSFTYDKNGNMLTKSSTSGTAVYSWDLENRLLSATVPANNGSYKEKFAKCVEDNRLDNALRNLGAAYGHPDAGNALADLTAAGTTAAIANQVTNLTASVLIPVAYRTGVYGGYHSTTWQHFSFGLAARMTGNAKLSAFGKAFGRLSAAASAVMIVGEGAYDGAAMARCAVVAGQD